MWNCKNVKIFFHPHIRSYIFQWFMFKLWSQGQSWGSSHSNSLAPSQVTLRLFSGYSQVILRLFSGDSKVIRRIFWCFKGFLKYFHIFYRGKEEIGLPSSTSMSTQDKILSLLFSRYCRLCRHRHRWILFQLFTLLLMPMSTSMSGSGLLQYFGPTTNTDVNVDVDVDLLQIIVGKKVRFPKKCFACWRRCRHQCQPLS